MAEMVTKFDWVPRLMVPAELPLAVEVETAVAAAFFALSAELPISANGGSGIAVKSDRSAIVVERVVCDRVLRPDSDVGIVLKADRPGKEWIADRFHERSSQIQYA
jgi:hypothetical protein